MRILRHIVVGSVFGGSALAIAFACVDRLDHPAPVRPAPTATLTRIRPPEPTVTGSLPAEAGPSISDILGRDAAPRSAVARVAPPAPKTTATSTAAREAPARIAAKPAAPKPVPPKPAVKKTAEGFDTERLNALMRGDPAVTLTRSR